MFDVARPDQGNEIPAVWKEPIVSVLVERRAPSRVLALILIAAAIALAIIAPVVVLASQF